MNKKHKETKTERKKRIELINTVQTKIIPDKTLYNRNIKHKGQ